ncbi:hypothetical protein AAD018_004030 [Aestuariibius insulae]|uniref:hypothetical protein n=1 Tax=Aestuariibius insulae TaxID=2058287 RepID=UPI00345E7CE1
MSKTLKLLGLTAAVAVIAGCARNEPEPVVFTEPAPIFTKDGQIIQQRPVVVAPASNDVNGPRAGATSDIEGDPNDDDAAGLGGGL